ncbi:MAG: lysophospholipase [Clostridia bacterium]|nr:lysophospholipase [Clostridia bacterium]
MPPIVTIIILAVIIFGIAPMVLLSFILYSVLMVRNKPEKWGRECSAPEDPVMVRMFEDGVAWGKAHADVKRDVEIENDGFKLVGEYYDFGFDKAVIILPGRTESLLYSLYFAEPYRKCGRNVLVIDQRSHGLSEGTFNSVGLVEYRDTLKWAELLHDKLGNREIFIHGICIGSSNALNALTSAGCPDYINGMAAEGMYINFCETFGNHMKDMNKPTFPLLYGVMAIISLRAHAGVISNGPLKRIEKLKKPILFLHSREDIYSLPEKSSAIFEKCTAKKRVVWFDHGGHSRVRQAEQEKYDASIADFLRDFIDC